MPEKLKYNLQQHFKNSGAVALWRLPDGAHISVLLANKIEEFQFEALAGKEAGFAFFPFSAKDKGYFLQGEKYFTTTNLLDLEEATGFYFSGQHIKTETDEHYKANVAKAVIDIKAGLAEKIVLGRNKAAYLPPHFSLLAFFETLCRQYANAFVSLVSIPGVGTWIGATPEYILKVTEENLTTVALAGTQISGRQQWTEKESEEQQVVTDFLEEILDEYQVDQVSLSPRKLIHNGPLEHLYTKVSFKKSGIPTNKLAAAILPALHPTPAVGGLPKQGAIDFILQNENYHRQYYTGFLGPVNYNHESHLFVNLRCMQWNGSHAVLYAGAGITAGSDPEKEFVETENKMANLARYLA